MADGVVKPAATGPATTTPHPKGACDCVCFCVPDVMYRPYLGWTPSTYAEGVDGEAVVGPVAYPVDLIGRDVGFGLATAPDATRDDAHLARDGQLDAARRVLPADLPAVVMTEMPLLADGLGEDAATPPSASPATTLRVDALETPGSAAGPVVVALRDVERLSRRRAIQAARDVAADLDASPPQLPSRPRALAPRGRRLARGEETAGGVDAATASLPSLGDGRAPPPRPFNFPGFAPLSAAGRPAGGSLSPAGQEARREGTSGVTRGPSGGAAGGGPTRQGPGAPAGGGKAKPRPAFDPKVGRPPPVPPVTGPALGDVRGEPVRPGLGPKDVAPPSVEPPLHPWGAMRPGAGWVLAPGVAPGASRPPASARVPASPREPDPAGRMPPSPPPTGPGQIPADLLRDVGVSASPPQEPTGPSNHPDLTSLWPEAAAAVTDAVQVAITPSPGREPEDLVAPSDGALPAAPSPKAPSPPGLQLPEAALSTLHGAETIGARPAGATVVPRAAIPSAPGALPLPSLVGGGASPRRGKSPGTPSRYAAARVAADEARAAARESKQRAGALRHDAAFLLHRAATSRALPPTSEGYGESVDRAKQDETRATELIRLAAAAEAEAARRRAEHEAAASDADQALEALDAENPRGGKALAEAELARLRRRRSREHGRRTPHRQAKEAARRSKQRHRDAQLDRKMRRKLPAAASGDGEGYPEWRARRDAVEGAEDAARLLALQVGKVEDGRKRETAAERRERRELEARARARRARAEARRTEQAQLSASDRARRHVLARARVRRDETRSDQVKASRQSARARDKDKKLDAKRRRNLAGKATPDGGSAYEAWRTERDRTEAARDRDRLDALDEKRRDHESARAYVEDSEDRKAKGEKLGKEERRALREAKALLRKTRETDADRREREAIRGRQDARTGRQGRDPNAPAEDATSKPSEDAPDAGVEPSDGDAPDGGAPPPPPDPCAGCTCTPPCRDGERCVCTPTFGGAGGGGGKGARGPVMPEGTPPLAEGESRTVAPRVQHPPLAPGESRTIAPWVVRRRPPPARPCEVDRRCCAEARRRAQDRIAYYEELLGTWTALRAEAEAKARSHATLSIARYVGLAEAIQPPPRPNAAYSLVSFFEEGHDADCRAWAYCASVYVPRLDRDLERLTAYEDYLALVTLLFALALQLDGALPIELLELLSYWSTLLKAMGYAVLGGSLQRDFLDLLRALWEGDYQKEDFHRNIESRMGRIRQDLDRVELWSRIVDIGGLAFGPASVFVTRARRMAAMGAKVRKGGRGLPRKTRRKRSALPAGTKRQTGGRSGEFASAEEAWAVRRYDEIRADAGDVGRIAESTGLRRVNVEKVKNHVFLDEHVKDKYAHIDPDSVTIGRLDPDPEQVRIWERLQSGRHTPDDIAWLKHEIAERKHMHLTGSRSYGTAHGAVQPRWPSPLEGR